MSTHSMINTVSCPSLAVSTYQDAAKSGKTPGEQVLNQLLYLR